MPGTLLSDRLLRREIGRHDLYTKPKGLYGDRKWVKDLDIVNELDGHSGCVNALSWSKSGRLLASGSDDTHLNIHAYQPDSTDNPFALTTTVLTGHSANIFSVKFMPHSNDRTVVTCAGDYQIRVFDIDRAATSNTTASADETEGFLSHGIRYLSEADTNARVFRSHSDRVKRIVTESSPFLFLSCSEDGEVRQWDIRQPSSAYPRARGARTFMGSMDNDDVVGDVPPPLISYKRYNLDLNTISCSPSQPHYIALGGTHLHCFLHDRRMLGRDILEEQGKSANAQSGGGHDDDLVSAATKCVKKFAPKGQRKMKRGETGHITACKISDANPNEMIASWSGDWIYNFDLLRDPDAAEDIEETGARRRRRRDRVQASRNRKRKRDVAGSSASLEGRSRGDSKPKTSEAEAVHTPDASMALRVRYENGQTEHVPIAHESDDGADEANGLDAPASVAIAKVLVDIRKTIFTLNDRTSEDAEDPTGYATSFDPALRNTLSVLEDIDKIMRTWRYPVDPEDGDVTFQNTLRSHRDRSRRFVQACGTVSRLLGGSAQRTWYTTSPTSLDKVYVVQSSSLEREIQDPSEQFCYDFIKAICLWLESGPGALADNFSGKRNRRPLPPDPSIDDIDDALIPYLLRLASDRPIPNVDASRFEIDENRIAFPSEKAAVLTFARAIKIPFTDLSQAVVPGSADSEHRNVHEGTHHQERAQAVRFWGLKIARGLLMNAGEGISFAFVDRAFGGLGETPRGVRQEEATLSRQTENVESDDDDIPVAAVGLSQGKRKGNEAPQEFPGTKEDRARRIHNRLTEQSSRTRTSNGNGHSHQPTIEETEDTDELMMPIEDDATTEDEAREPQTKGIPGAEASSPDTADDDDIDVGSEDDDALSASSDSEDDDAHENPMSRDFLIRASFARTSMRHKCNRNVPGVGPQLHYEGAANVRTVKDVNFYGLNDEYVVSGSDSGHLFIWDRASGQLLNILEGDGEVVNVVQGHPYEPMLAVSGIDHTIKIFGADKQARDNARKGTRLKNTGHSGFSTLGMGGRTRFGRARRPRPAARHERSEGEAEPLLSTSEPAMPENSAQDSDTETEEAAIAPNGLSSRRRMHLRAQITSENDVDRRGAGRDAFITRGMLAQLAARMRQRRGGQEGGGEGQEGGGDDDGADQIIEIDGDNVVIRADGGCHVQ